MVAILFSFPSRLLQRVEQIFSDSNASTPLAIQAAQSLILSLSAKMKLTKPILFSLFLWASWATAQVESMGSPQLSTQGTILSLPPNNSISHIAPQGNVVFIGTSKGLAHTNDGGRTWESFRGIPQFANDGIFSFSVRGTTIWAATGFNKPVPNDESKTVQTGSGYAYSFDSGATWRHADQPLDGAGDSLVQYGTNQISFLPIIVPEQNVTFDLALTDSIVWVASWSSGLRKANYRTAAITWQRTVLPSDSRNSVSPSDQLGGYKIDPRQNNNFLAFSVFVENDSTVWCGTAGGINKSTDRGTSWTKFSAQNQVSHILGNWVIAINGQRVGARTRLWCTNWRASDNTEQFGISYTDDGGRIWKNFLHGVKAYDFAFKDSIVYVATDEGVFRTADGGNSWAQSGTIVDKTNGQRITTKRFFSVGVLNDTVYCGSGDGLVKTVDNATNPFGQTWQVLRAYRPLDNNTSTTYIYPNPFSPKQEQARVHYSTGGRSTSVTVEVFDFGMNRVRTIVKDAQRSGANEHDELWDGLDDTRRTVANGVYFYRVTIDGAEPAWGKVMVLQ
jgi:hypothetical protein